MSDFNVTNDRIVEVDLEYLLENIKYLQEFTEEDDREFFVLKENFNYYSPRNWNYDFTQADPVIQLGNTVEPGLLINEKGDKIAIYIHENLVSKRPEILYKAYSKEKKLEPTLIDYPLFAINTEESTKDIVPLILIGFQHVIKNKNQDIYQKFGNLLN